MESYAASTHSAPHGQSMIKTKFKKTTLLLRRNSGTADFRVVDPGRPTKLPFTPRTADDESIDLHTADVKLLIPESKHSDLRQMGDNLPTLREQQGTTQVDDFLNRLNLDKAGAFMKATAINLLRRFLASPYINSINDGRIHIHSFGLGVAMTAIVVMVQPYLVVYLDSWMALLTKLFKHLMAWLVVGGLLTYVLNPKKATDAVTRGRGAEFKELKYSVKSSTESSRASSPRKKQLQTPILRRPVTVQRRETEPVRFSRRGSDSAWSDQQVLMNTTAQMQDIERAKYDMERARFERPRSGYEKFMDGAFKKDEEKEKYNKFVDDTREGLKRKVEQTFAE